MERRQYVGIDVPFGGIFCHLRWGCNADRTAIGIEDFAIVVLVFLLEGWVFESGQLSETADCLVCELRCYVFIGVLGDDEHHVDLFFVRIDCEFGTHDLRMLRLVVEFLCHLCADGRIVEGKIRRFFFFGTESEVERGKCDDNQNQHDELAFGGGAFFRAATTRFASGIFFRCFVFFHIYLPFCVDFCPCYHSIFARVLKGGEVVGKIYCEKAFLRQILLEICLILYIIKRQYLYIFKKQDY